MLAGDHLTPVPDLAVDQSNADTRNAAIKKNLALFVAKMDEGMYKLLKSLASPKAMGDCSYEECKQLLLDHLAPAPTKFAQRYKLRSCLQEADESTATYISRLRSIANECDFTNYNEAILDQLLAGLRDQKVVSELLTKGDLTLEVAVREALSREQANKEAQYMNSVLSTGGESSKSVNSVRNPSFKRTMNMKNPYKKGEGSMEQKSPDKQQNTQQKGSKCGRCGLRGHSAENCQVRCYRCNKVGHTSRKCRQARGDRVNNIGQEEPRDNESEWGMDEGCLHVLDDELYSDHKECYMVETSVANGKIACSNLKSISSNLHSNIDSYCAEADSADMHVVNSLNNAESLLINVTDSFNEKSNVALCFADSVNVKVADIICAENKYTCEASDNLRADMNMIDLSKPCVEVKINDKTLYMEFDSGSAVSVVSQQALTACGLTDLTLTPSRKTLRVASGQIKTVDGCAQVDVVLKGEEARGLQLYVAKDFPSLFGRPWIEKFCGQDWLDKLLNTRSVNTLFPDKSHEVSVSCKSCSGSGVNKGGDMLTDGEIVKNGWYVENTCTSFSQCRTVDQLKLSDVFKPGLGLVKGVQASLVLKDNSKPIMLKARSLPYALRDKVESELNSMVEAKILSKVEDSPWGTPLVPVEKDGGVSIRICGDYKSTLNKCISTKQYPLPTLEECFNSIQGGQKFSKIDIKKAYNNMLIREEDRVLTTLNTHKGLYQWNRLPFGISSASAIFQSVMDDTLKGVPMTCCRIDDILVSGKDDADHLINLNNVITRLERRGFKCKIEKTSFMQNEVIYLGHIVSASGIRPARSKVDSLLMAPEPRNVDELISFLGAVNYYRRYLPNLSAVIAPLERLRAKDVKWQWLASEQKAFKALKQLLSSDRVLTFYNPKLPLKLDTDAALGGIGAVLSHVMPNGEERPIEFISRTLSPAERNYAQIDKEALAIVWAIKRLHMYLYMRRFKLVTDHRALVRIFGDKPIPEMTAGRITRWALFMMNYQYDIEYRNTKDHSNADMLSRLPRTIKHSVPEKDEVADVFALTMSESLLDAEDVARETRADPILSKVLNFTLNGWPQNLKCEGDMRAFWSRRDELSHELGCLTWGARVVIPVKLRSTVMKILHSTHIGVSGMKSLARSYVYWPRLDTQIEDTARTCETCGKYGKNLPKVVDHPWAKTSAPFQRVHCDFAGPFLGCMWLLLVDSYSKWPEIINMNSNTTASATIRAFRSIFSRTGFPICMVTDNGSQLVSDEMEEYLKFCGIKHVTVPTYSPKSNGICERLVQSFKTTMKKMYESCKDKNKNLDEFLMTYRNTPHSSTGQAPAVMAFNRTLRSKLHQIQPADSMRKQELQSDKLQEVINVQAKTREFHEEQPVFVKMNDESNWEPAQVLRRLGDSSNNYEIQHENRVVKKHADAIKPRHTPMIRLKKDVIPESQKDLLTRELHRSNVERRRLRSANTGDRTRTEPGILSSETPATAKQPSPQKLVSNPDISGLVKPMVGTPAVELQSRPARTAKSAAIVKMKGMS